MKCLVIETSPERTSAHTVTDEDGTPHIYATIAKARAELKANGYKYSRANDRYYLAGTDYRAYIIREDSDEYAEAFAQAQREAFANAHIVKYISRKGAEEIHALRFEKALSWYELAQRYGITEHQARKAYNIIHYNKYRVFEYETEAERTAEPEAAQVFTYLTDVKPDEHSRVVVSFVWSESAARYYANVYTVSRFGIVTGNGTIAQGKTLAGCKAGFDRASARYFQQDEPAHLLALVHHGGEFVSMSCTRSFYCDPDDPNVHEAFKTWARSLFTEADEAAAERYGWTPEEYAENIEYRAQICAANAAALALLDAYAEATGEHPHEDDDETHAAYLVARDEITGTSARAHEYDRALVADMVELIAEHAARQAMYRDDMEQEQEPRPYQRTELEAYLGEPAAFDIEAIEAEATERTADGRHVWREGINLADIAARHQHRKRAPRTYYAQMCPYGIRTASDVDTLWRFPSRDARDRWTERKPEKRAEIDREHARRWYPQAFSATPTDGRWKASDGAEVWTGYPTGGVYDRS